LIWRNSHAQSIKVGFNMRRKAILISIRLSLPVLLALGARGLLFRTAHLFFIRSPASAWTRCRGTSTVNP
jgi:hypothetical protein